VVVARVRQSITIDMSEKLWNKNASEHLGRPGPRPCRLPQGVRVYSDAEVDMVVPRHERNMHLKIQ
jgi:hypothetical protein